jgi:branched-chain amino acid transport system substrate-binding protein
MSLVKRTIGVAASVAVAFATFVAPAQAAPAGCDGDMKLIFQGGLTGSAAQTGIGEYNGFKLAVLQYNEKRGSGPKVEPGFIDTQADPSQTPPLALATVNDPCVIGVVGGMYSGETRAALPIYLKGGLPLISPSATNETLPAVGGDVFHRVVANDGVQGPALAKLAGNQPNAKVFIVDDQSTYGKDLASIVKKTLAKNKQVGSDSVATGTTNFSSVVAKVRKAGANTVFFGGYYPEASKFVKQLRDNAATKNVKFIAGDGVLDNEYIKLAKKNAEGTSMTAPYIPMERADKKLTAIYKKEYGVAPAVYTLEAYNAAGFFLAAVKAGNDTRAEILNYINTNSYKGVGQTLKFDAKGEPAVKVMNEFIVKNGKIEYVGVIK